jgi:hypothetical protein
VYVFSSSLRVSRSQGTHKCRITGKNLSKSKVEREFRARPIHGKMKTGSAI